MAAADLVVVASLQQGWQASALPANSSTPLPNPAHLSVSPHKVNIARHFLSSANPQPYFRSSLLTKDYYKVAQLPPSSMASTASQPLDYDGVLQSIGQFGRWQRRIFFMMCLVSAMSGLFVVTFAFTGYEPKYRCIVPYCEEASSAVYGNKSIDSAGYVYSDIVSLAIPAAALTRSNLCQYKDLDKEASGCEEFRAALKANSSNLVVKQCEHSDLVFDQTYVKSSIFTEYGLTCSNSWLGQVYGATYMVGLLFGSFILGLISDKFGRVKTLMLAVFLSSVSGIICAFMPVAPAYGFFRFITGLGGMGCFMIAFVICVEFVGVKFTMLVGILIEVPFALGELLLGLEAYLLRDYLSLQLVAHAPFVLMLVLWFLVPESPRWLLATGQTAKAREVIIKGATINKKSLPENLFPDEDSSQQSSDAKQEAPAATVRLTDLFRVKSIFLRSLNMFYQWFAVTMCYYGLTFASTEQSLDPYISFCLSIVIEIPGYVFCVFVMDCWGRRPILSFTQLFSGIACISAGLLDGVTDLSILQSFFLLVGKFGASACFAIVYVYSAEMFPTVIRNSAIGFCSTMARIGAISALLIRLLRDVAPMAPMLLLGVSAIVAGCLALFFPETVGQKLPDTMDDAIRIGEHNKRGICTCVCPKSLNEVFQSTE